MKRVVTTHELPRTADCVIIGGGVLGAATAFYAARAGLGVVVLEKRPALATLTTPASAGAFRAQFDSQEETRLMRESIGVFANFAEHTGLEGYDIGLRQQGYLWLTTSEAGAERQKALVKKQQDWGLDDVELISGDEARRRFPYLAPEVVSARFRQGDGWLDPKRLTMGFATASGAPFVLETEVTGFTVRSRSLQAVKTNRGTIASKYAVIAAGPFSAAVARLAGFKLDIALRIRQKLVFPEVPEVPPDAPMTIDEDTGAHWRPEGRGAYLLYPQGDTPAGPALSNVPTDVGFYFELLRPESPAAVARLSPFWRQVWERNTDLWFLTAGQYSYTPDHRPYLGPTPVEGLAVNCGYSGHGIMGSAGGSRLAVETMLGRLKPDQNPFRLRRPLAPRSLDGL